MILSPSRAVRVFAHPAPVDLRKGYDGLYGLVEHGLRRDPMSGDLFLFVNESRKLCKVLVWDGSGLCIFQKRLARGCFAKLWRDDDQVVRLTQSELALFIEGSTILDRRSLSPVVIERKPIVSDREMRSKRDVVRDELEREQNIEELRRLALAVEAQNRLLLDLLGRKSREVDQLRGKNGDIQLTLKMLEALQTKARAAQEATERATVPKPSEKTRRSSMGPTEQPKLPVVEREFVLDEPDRTCTSCGGELTAMKDQFEESEMIDVIEARYELVQVKQQKYVCQCSGCVETALGPTRAQPGSRYSLAFAIKIVLDKWMDHIPLERQVRILQRHGLIVTSQTLWDLTYAVTKRLSLVDDALLAHVKAQPVIGLDQTGWPRLEAGASKPWQMWCLTAPGVVVHRIRDDKSAATFKDLVGDYTGTIVADALGTHEAGAREGPGIVLAGCWAHVFRRFEEALADHPDAERALAWIGALYDIDRRSEGDHSRIAALRRAEAPVILAEFRNWLFERAGDTHLSIGKAAAYTLGIWDRLTRFVDDARIPLDNNATERAIRGPVVGRKNHYGSKIAQRHRSRRDPLYDS